MRHQMNTRFTVFPKMHCQGEQTLHKYSPLLIREAYAAESEDLFQAVLG